MAVLLCVSMACQAWSPNDPRPMDEEFNTQVAEWSRELNRELSPPPNSKGNCTVVAIALQDRIVRSHKTAFIGAIHSGTVDHAVVVYDSNGDFQVDSVIDNGRLADHTPISVIPVWKGEYGKWFGYCRAMKPPHCILASSP